MTRVNYKNMFADLNKRAFVLYIAGECRRVCNWESLFSIRCSELFADERGTARMRGGATGMAGQRKNRHTREHTILAPRIGNKRPNKYRRKFIANLKETSDEMLCRNNNNNNSNKRRVRWVQRARAGAAGLCARALC